MTTGTLTYRAVMTELVVETPEGLTLRHEVAGAGSRAAAAMIDAALARRFGADFTAAPGFAALGARFETATRLEVGFWDMGMQGA